MISTREGFGGAETVLLALLEEGKRRDWVQAVIAPFDQQGSRSTLGTAVDDRSIIYEARGTKRLWDIPSTRRWLRKRLAAHAPDLVGAHLFHAAVLVASLPGTSSYKRVLTHHHGDHLQAMGRRPEERLDRWAGTRFDRVVACSEWVGRYLVSHYGYRRQSVSVIRNGWSGSPLRPNKSPSEVTVLVCVANFREQKDHRTLVEAFARVVDVLPGTRLKLLGDGPLLGETKALVECKGLSDVVDFRGRVNDIWAELATSDVSVLTSLYEPLGIAILESMAASLPVVATRVGGVPEVVDHGVTGILVPPQDTDAFARALLEVIQDPELRQRFGEAGRKKAASMTMERTVDSYFDLYESLMS